uniref:Ribosomal_L7Ae domain-containing protein n=1 Tax=Schistocephalus solidus TaxID=70667 RepID=A0A183THS1_SCHSO
LVYAYKSSNSQISLPRKKNSYGKAECGDLNTVKNKVSFSKRSKLLAATRKSNEKPRALFVCLRDIVLMMAHSKTDDKLDTKKCLLLVNELADMRSVIKVIYIVTNFVKHNDGVTCNCSVHFAFVPVVNVSALTCATVLG